MKIVGLLGAKLHSKRLPNKAWKMMGGIPMFEHNVIKGVGLFDKMYVSSDDYALLNRSEKLGAIPILRTDPKLMEAPNIDYYLHALQFMDNPEAIVALQVNSPTIKTKIISDIKELMERGYEEVKTCHEDYSDYGSVWAIRTDKIKNYPDPYNAKPSVWIKDPSVDIHTQEDLDEALKQL